MPQSFSALAWSTLLLPLLGLFPLQARAIEEPGYTVVRKLADVEVRHYSGYAVAEVVMPGPEDTAGNQAFPILAGYIFGKNKGERRMEMTAPVTQTAAPVKMEMTAPVTQTATPAGYVIQFVLPAGITAANAPEPNDARVRVRDVPPVDQAVIRYTGFWSKENYDAHLSKLQAALREAGLKWTGEPVFSRYDPPFTPWFLRRNEIWLQVAAD